MSQRTVPGDGVDLAVHDHGDPAHPAMLLVHGFPDTQTLWAPVVDRLRDRFHVITYDLRGAGDSGVPTGERPYALDHLARDAAAVLDAVVPGETVHLVGHDWGAIQGWEFLYAEATRGRWRSYTCVSGASFDHAGLLLREHLRNRDLRALARAAGQMRRSWYMLALQSPTLFVPLWRRVLAPRWGRLLALREGVAPDGEFPAATIASDGAHLSGLYWRTPLERIARPRRTTAVEIPVQVIRPEHDRFLAPHTLDGLERFAPRLTRRSVPGGHWAPRSAPGPLAALIAEHALAADAGTVPAA